MVFYFCKYITRNSATKVQFYVVKRWREPKSRTNSRAISILHFVGAKFARALTMVLSVTQKSAAHSENRSTTSPTLLSLLIGL